MLNKILGILPKGKGTKITAGAGVLVATLALVGDFTGHPIPGISLTRGEALVTLWGGIVALYLRRSNPS